ncbi:TIGR02453 family protein [Kriegella sp. EG-1]|nr:TIGR02453 family protein [Flavobacteriaceae bacterium EG-1]
MDFKNQIDFLKELQKNNNKEWMDLNRKWYKEVRDDFIGWLDGVNARLTAIDDEYYDTPGKKGINRINNNLMFHPNKPVYKDHFGAGLDKRPNTGDFYIEIGIERCIFAGGLWRPDPKRLRSIRDAIDYDGEELHGILKKKSFNETFGGLYEDVKLKNAPKGFSNNHRHIALLRNKTFAVATEFSTQEIFEPDFEKKVIKVYKEMLPFRRYLNKAITV